MKRFDLSILIAAVAIVAGGVGFAVGHASAPKTTPSASSGSGGYSANQGGGNLGTGGGGMRMRGFGTRGTVSGVSGNTITLTDQNGATRTINVTTSTSYLNGADRSSSSLSAVTTGTSILASGVTGSDGTINATRIIISPPSPGSFGGGQGAAPQGSSSGTAPAN